MDTLRNLLNSNDQNIASNIPMTTIADYIATRFLGVLTYFGVFLISTDLEKKMQSEMLLSLGDIIRFMGSKHITPFRFKILTVLASAITIPRNEIKEICAKIWKIFIYTVDVQSMGPLLSIIVVSLEPLLLTNPNTVNEILKYLIIDNGNLLSIYIADLFFLEETKINKEIKDYVLKHLQQKNEGNNFAYQLKLYSKQINHENMEVRVYALRYLTTLFQHNRRNLNNLIIGQQQMSPIIEEILNTLMLGTRHIDEHLQIASAICLGVIGAIEPSHLPPNYAPQNKIALSIHSDAFSIMALAELCRAYQFQKDTQRVDGFSLAIQEILLARGVCPDKKNKMNVWNAIPERMRQLMEPLLKSCYTPMASNFQNTVHPIYGCARCTSSEFWAYFWAASMIEFVQDEDTKHLLRSFKSSIRHDTDILSMFLPYIIVHTLQSCSEENFNKIEEELKTVFSVITTETGADNTTQMEIAVKCGKIAFNQLDFLDRWLRQCCANSRTTTNYTKIELFLSKFDKKSMASINFKCGEYARALMYLGTLLKMFRKDYNLSFLF